MQFPLPTPCFNVALNGDVRASTIWINIENGERGKSLVITPQWSNTFGPDCSLLMQMGNVDYITEFTTDLISAESCYPGIAIRPKIPLLSIS